MQSTHAKLEHHECAYDSIGWSLQVLVLCRKHFSERGEMYEGIWLFCSWPLLSALLSDWREHDMAKEGAVAVKGSATPRDAGCRSKINFCVWITKSFFEHKTFRDPKELSLLKKEKRQEGRMEGRQERRRKHLKA